MTCYTFESKPFPFFFMINSVTHSKTVWVVHAEKTVKGSLLIAVLTGVHLT